MRLVVAATLFFDWRGHQGELLSATEALESRPEARDADPLAVRVVLSRSKIVGQIDPGRVIARLDAALATARELGDTGLAAEVLNRLAWLSWSIGDYPASERLHAQAVASARESGSYVPLSMALNGGGASKDERLEALELTSSAGDYIGRYMVLCNLGAIALDDGDVQAARGYFEEALPIIEAARPGGADPSLLVNLGSALVLDGEHTAARPLYGRALEAARRHLDDRQQGYGLFGLAICAARDGEALRGATLCGAAEERFERAGFALEQAERRLANENEGRLRRMLGVEAFESACAAGRRLSKDQAIDLALGRASLGGGPETDSRVSSPVR
jgi:tetratricopeptide (TPR) repeat protein